MNNLYSQRQLGVWYFYETLKYKQTKALKVLEAITILSSCIKNMDDKKLFEFYTAICKFLRGWGVEPVQSKYMQVDEYKKPYWVLNRDLEVIEKIREGCDLDEDGEEKTID
jgi:hypothetical protein